MQACQLPASPLLRKAGRWGGGWVGGQRGAVAGVGGLQDFWVKSGTGLANCWDNLQDSFWQKHSGSTREALGKHSGSTREGVKNSPPPIGIRASYSNRGGLFFTPSRVLPECFPSASRVLPECFCQKLSRRLSPQLSSPTPQLSQKSSRPLQALLPKTTTLRHSQP